MKKANSMDRAMDGPMEGAVTPYLPRLKQVGMTFVSHRWLSLIYLVAASLCILRIALTGKNEVLEVLSVLGVTAFFVVGTLSCLIFTKYWFARSEAKLIPGHRTSHVLFLGIVLVVQYFLMPLLLATKLGVNAFGASALAICFISSLFMATDKPRYIVLIFILGATIAVPSLQEVWLKTDPLYRPIRILLFLAGWGLTIYWVRRQTTMDEETDGYSLPQLAMAMEASNRRSRTQQNQLVAKQMSRNWFWTRLSDLALDRLISNKNTSRSQLTGKSFMAGPLPIGVIQAIIFTSIFAVVIQTLLLFFHNSENLAWSMLNQPLMFSLIMPGMMLQQLWSQKKPLMASELLRENGREDYFQSLYFHSLKHTLYGTLAFLLGALILVYAFWELTITPLAISCFLTTAIASNSLFASFAIWGSSFRSKLAGISLFIVPFTMGIFAYMAFLLIFRKQFFGPKATNDFSFLNEPSVFLPIYAGSFIAFILSLVILRMSYKKWLRTELG